MTRGPLRLRSLKPGDRVLVAEACSHHPITDDIGREKIPSWLTRQAGGDTILSTRVVQGSQVAVMNDGAVAVSYYDSTDDGIDAGLSTVMAAVSSDYGASFTDPVVAGVYQEGPGVLRTASFRYGGLPSMAIGPDNEIYIVQTGRPVGDPADDSDVYIFRSFDQGVTWEEGVRMFEEAKAEDPALMEKIEFHGIETPIEEISKRAVELAREQEGA